MKKYLYSFLAMIICFVIGFAFGQIYDLDDASNKSTFKIEVAETQVKNISELATMEYKYTNVGEMGGDNALKIFGKSIPFTDKSLTVQYDGIIKLGPDMAKAKIKQDGEDKLIITIPHAKVLSHEIDENSWKILEKKNGIFNPVKVEDSDKMRKELKEEMAKTAADEGLLEEADKVAVEKVKGFIKATYPNMEVEVKVK